MEIEKEIVREVVRGGKHNLRKSANRNAQISVINSAYVLICALQFADFLRLCLSPRTTSRTISFSIFNTFGLNLIPFRDICSVLAVLSPGLFGFVLLYLGHCVVATVTVCGFGRWVLVFDVDSGLPRQISPQSPLKQRCAPRWEKAYKTVVYHGNPTLSANKHVVQICRSSLSAAVHTVQVERRTSPFNGFERSLCRAVVIKTKLITLTPRARPFGPKRCSLFVRIPWFGEAAESLVRSANEAIGSAYFSGEVRAVYQTKRSFHFPNDRIPTQA